MGPSDWLELTEHWCARSNSHLAAAERIIRRICEYSRRQLTHSNDRLNAFKGVLKAYECLEPPVRHHWGVPILPPRANPKGEKHNGNESSCAGFVLGLCWQHCTMLSKRLPEFPSWSWSGWDGKTNARIHELYLEDSSRWADANDVRIRVELSNGSLLNWDEFISEEFCRKSSGSIPASIYLLIDAWTMPVKLHYDSNRDIGGKYHRFYVLVKDGLTIYRFWYSSPIREPSAIEIEDIEGGTYTGIILGSRMKSNFILVAEEKDGYMQRVGSFFLEYPSVNIGYGGEHWEPLARREYWDVNQLPWERRAIRLG